VKVFTLFLIVFTISSCDYFRSPGTVDLDDFKISHKNQVVCFDLTNDAKIRGVILIKSENKTADHTIILPFKATQVENSQEVLSTSGNFGNLSIFSYKGSSSGEPEYTGIKFIPVLNDWPENMSTEDEMEDGLYFTESGAECKFIYKYAKFASMQAKYINVALDTVQSIAIKLPEKAKEIVLPNGRVSDPDPTASFGNLKYFETNHKLLAKVEISYLLPANKKQIAVFNFILKLATVLLVPLIDLIFLKPNRRFTPKVKKIVKWSSNDLFCVFF